MSLKEENNESEIPVSQMIEVPTNRLWVGIAVDDKYLEVNPDEVADIMLDKIGGLNYIRFIEIDGKELLPPGYNPLAGGVDIFVDYIPEWAPSYANTPRIPFIILNPQPTTKG